MHQILGRYKTLLVDIDKKCDEFFRAEPGIPCAQKCTDCCKQLFLITFVEADEDKYWVIIDL